MIYDNISKKFKFILEFICDFLRNRKKGVIDNLKKIDFSIMIIKPKIVAVSLAVSIEMKLLQKNFLFYYLT